MIILFPSIHYPMYISRRIMQGSDSSKLIHVVINMTNRALPSSSPFFLCVCVCVLMGSFWFTIGNLFSCH